MHCCYNYAEICPVLGKYPVEHRCSGLNLSRLYQQRGTVIDAFCEKNIAPLFKNTEVRLVLDFFGRLEEEEGMMEASK